MTFVAGPYTSTLAASALGITENGFELTHRDEADIIRGDNLGQTDQDWVYRGGQTLLNTVLQEYDAAGALAAFWPYHATFGRHGQAGVLGSSVAAALVLTAVAGTTASAAPATLTITLAALDPGFDWRMLFAARLRNVPLRMKALPNNNAGVITWFTST